MSQSHLVDWELRTCLTALPGLRSMHGLIMDLLMTLNRIYRDDEVGKGGGALLTAMELQHKMKLESGSEAAALKTKKGIPQG